MWVAVVGPSGAGKDTLLAAARAALAGDARFHFARRVISRPEGLGEEGHEALDAAGFATADLAVRWRAHGLHYGIRSEETRRAPVTVMSLSRAVLEEVASRAPLTVIEVTAPPAALAARLAARGREGEAEIAARLAREVPLPEGLRVVRVANDGSVKQGAETLLAALETCVPAGIRP
ncbi:MAG TPA: phosphonate metabolism protein/1,5-bisphosphokinase (PRPP-forming) PhnN [Roseococcus sp.]|jgi:phosphonate metabolism protein PhnN/1,5-bisphosphokinase (PRPP-forming)|nr:phosphonate metabolism protein/1,5-bisphosphokinase (PRPP-forming) PhnN [Roseococcus sp.]